VSGYRDYSKSTQALMNTRKYNLGEVGSQGDITGLGIFGEG